METRFTQSPAAADTKIVHTLGGGARIAGYGAVFYDGTPRTEYRLSPTLVERIMPGAFDAALRRDDVRALFNHNPDMLLARTASGTMKLSTDSRGLKYEIQLPDDELGKRVLNAIRRRDLTGASFSFTIDSQQFRADGKQNIREIKAVNLRDVGPVTFPAYEMTTAETQRDDHSAAAAAAERDRLTRIRERNLQLMVIRHKALLAL